MIRDVNLRDRRLLACFFVGLALIGVFLVAGPHDVLHGDPHGSPDVDCQLCFVHGTETPEPIRVVRPVTCVAHSTELEGEDLESDWDWAASDPRAPPVCV